MNGSVNKVILIGTPNKGVVGRVETLCSVVGEKLECEDMKQNSIFMSKLNDPNYAPKNVDNKGIMQILFEKPELYKLGLKQF